MQINGFHGDNIVAALAPSMASRHEPTRLTDIHVRSAILFALVAGTAIPGGRLRAQADSVTRWQFLAGADAGSPGGWVAVRENAIAGTRLSLARDLGVHHVFRYTLGIARRLGERTRLDVTLTGTSLAGRAVPARDVVFNGATLEAGAPLETAVGPSRFVTGTLAVDRRLVALGRGWLSVRGGITFTGLTFVLHGTPTAGSAHHETQEDFVTQELPVPLGGLTARLPIAARVSVFADVEASGIPRVNSLRREGGEVTLKQSAAGLTAGVDMALGRALRAAVGYRAAIFSQHEASNEDGNDILLRERTLALRLTLAR